MSESESEEEVAKAEGRHAEALMRLIHRVTASNAGRTTMELNIRQRLVLQCLGLDGDQPIAAMGQRLGLSPSTMTGLVDRLEEQGHVKRRPHPSDRRVTVLAVRPTATSGRGRDRGIDADGGVRRLQLTGRKRQAVPAASTSQPIDRMVIAATW